MNSWATFDLDVDAPAPQQGSTRTKTRGGVAGPTKLDVGAYRETHYRRAGATWAQARKRAQDLGTQELASVARGCCKPPRNRLRLCPLKPAGKCGLSFHATPRPPIGIHWGS